MVKNEEELKDFLKKIPKENILFKEHFYDKQKIDRQYLNEEWVINTLKNINNFAGFQDQSNNSKEQYRVGIKISSQYNLVVICEIKGKSLYIITAWKTSKKWQKATQK